MIPTEYINLANTFEKTTYPTRTYKFDMENKRIIGYTDGAEAMKQAIYKILRTERFEYIIYSWNYGIELTELMDRLYPYIYSVLEERIIDALMQDDRIMKVYNFVFTRNKPRKDLLVTFNADTTEGELVIEKEVHI